eukprot:Hpha_TRINITY_DN15097_c2_g7::TRINITY_DN15097_c2_g7_i1::g.123445::m.123445
MRTLLLMMAVVGVLGGRLNVVTQDALGQLRVQGLDPATGEKTEGTQIKLPDGDWELVNGTHGQSSAAFYTNSSLFLIAREKKSGNVSLFQMYAGGGFVHQVADITPMAKAAGGAAALHFDWDGVCNLILTAPSGETVKQYEISEYDGQIRPLPDQTLAAGWVQQKGLFGVRSPQGWWGRQAQRRRGGVLEAQCEDCQTYTLETPEGTATGEARTVNIVGRGVHNGSVVFNVSDEPTRLLTMSYAAGKNFGQGGNDIFIGLGECCDLRGCPEECEGHGGELSLVLYQGKSFWPQVLAILPGSSVQDGVAVRLGVAVDLQFPAGGSGEYATRVSVLTGGQVSSFQLVPGQYGGWTAVPMSQSPKNVFPDDRQPVVWAYTMS